MKYKVAIAAGGDSAEEGISLLSANTVFQNLDRSIYDVYLVKMRFDKWNVIINEVEYPIDKNDFSVTINGVKTKFDYVFIAIHGTPGEDGKLQAYFDLLKIPYSSPDHIGSTLTFNKWYCNTLLKQLGYHVAKSYYLRRGEKIDTKMIIEEVGLPCFVKPCSCGSSFGISKIKKEEELIIGITEAFEYDNEVMIESMLKGKELGCGVFRDKEEVIALPVTQIIPKGEFFDYAAKYQGDSDEITPARITDLQRDAVQKIAKEIYSKFNLRGIIRVDFMLIEDTPYIIEVNAVPGLSAESIVPQQLKAAGIPLNDFFNTIIETTKN